MTDQFARLRELLVCATPGPLVLATSNSWRRIEARHGREICAPTKQPDGHPDLHFQNGGPEGPDAQLLIEAYNALPALLAHHDAHQWQDIETAPRDGTPLILFAALRQGTVVYAPTVVTGWFLDSEGWIASSYSGQGIAHLVPFAWMRRPDFPTGEPK